MIKVIKTEKAPRAIGPYSQGIETANFIFTSGQIPINPLTGEIEKGIEKQTIRTLENLKNVLIASESGLSKVVKTTVFIKDMNDFVIINKIYGEFFCEPYPARSCVEVSRLPKDVLIEIEAIAVK